MVISTHMETAQPEGGSKAWKQVDRSTLQRIADLFPAPTLGQIFIARFVERAATERSIIPDLEEGDILVCAKSIAKLGEELHLSNDTTQKYVVLFKALGMLQKRKFMGQIAFILSLGIYHPPKNLEANLDYLIQKKTSRPKLRTMAVDVKARCQIYGLISQDLVSSLEQLQTLLHVEKGTSRRSLEQRIAQAQYITSKVLKVVLTSHLSAESTLGDGTGRQRENILLEHLLSDGDGGDTIHQQNLLKEGSRADSPHHQQDRESPRLASLGRFPEEGSSACLPDSLSQEDSGQREQEHESPVEGALERFSQPDGSSRLPRSTTREDSSQENQRSPLTESPQDREGGRRENDDLRSNLPNLSHRVDSGGAIRNVHVENIYTFIITFTLREPRLVAEFLAEQLEGDRRVYPKYQKLLHIQEGRIRDPHGLAAAFICTMVRWHRDGWNISNRPGGFFTKRCREYDAGVPEEVEDWITSYGQLSPSALLEALTKQGHPSRVPAMAAQPSSQKSAPRPLLPPLALSPQMRVEPARMVMSMSEAQALVQAVLHDHRTQLFRTQRLRIGKQTPRYAVLVDASVPGGPSHQTVVYSRAEWQARLDGMKTWRDLIYPPPSGPPRADLGKSSHGGETSR
ncbi:MAG: hypothetical protein NVS4B9_38340 [Ktedonobacteraceae bacterium]